MRRIGLTGGIGSGKSTVARLLAGLGALVVDTDAIARGLTLPGGAAMPAITQRFGAAAVAADGALDRDYMRGLILRDPAAKVALEALLHPLIGQAAEAQAAQAAPGQVVVFDVPLLVETGTWRQRVDRVLVVDCEPDTQRRRVQARSGWAPEVVQAVMDRQASRGQRLAVADAVIDNGADVSLDTLAQQVRQIWQDWRQFPCPPGGAL
ncbi:dephospho-CoA kinase [Ideonella sp. TBM-1]|uniref:Dephospho-CoA kinase n=1 Tax=Ideonella livida TaxID=2707176 RepID=A0A7C9TN33_9BURK|nr:dephospho-CoA kinase [Ideonella livida]